jgi:enolase-phosphatase E1
MYWSVLLPPTHLPNANPNISFIHPQFPYALSALPDVLAQKWDDPAFTPYRDAFPADARASPELLEAHVRDLTARDVKVASLKGLQGM